MKRAACLITALLLLLSIPAGAMEILFGVTAGGYLITIDPDTGQGTYFMHTGLGGIEGLEDHPSGLLYTIAQEHRLAVINPFTGDTEILGDIGIVSCAESLSWVEGELYGSGDLGFGCRSETLIKIDPVTGMGTVVGPFGDEWIDIDGLAYSPDDILYATDMDIDPDHRALLAVDPDSGEATLVSLVDERIIGLDFNLAGELFGVTIPDGTGGPSDLVRIDPSTGVVTTIGPTGFTSV